MTSEGKITTTEAAFILGINRATVTRWVHNGQLKPEYTMANGQMIFDHQYILDQAFELAVNDIQEEGDER
jgi:predicted site-specific integrase-resolvase